MSRSARPRADRILIIRLKRAGDVVMTTPAVSILRRALPEARLSYLVDAPYARLVDGHPDLDEVIVASGGGETFFDLVRRLRRARFDAVADFHGGPRASRLAWFSGAPLRAGYEIPWRNFIYGVRVPRSGPGGAAVHSVVNHAHLARALLRRLGADDGGPGVPPLRLPDARPGEKARLDAILARPGRTGDGARLAVLHIGAGNAFRDWGEENFLDLARRLSEGPGLRIALAGGPEDRDRAASILARAPAGTLSFAGDLNWAELRDLIGRSALFAGPDSGPMHVAASTATPIVAIFGPTLPAHFAPWRSDGVRIVEKAMDCRPCRQRECLTRDVRCLRAVTAAEVFGACLETLKRV